DNYNYTDIGIADMDAATQSHTDLNINLNGHTLNKTSLIMIVNTGAKTLNLDGGNTQGSTDLNFNVETGGKLNICGKTNLRGNIAGDGTTEFNGEIVIADGVHLGTAINNVNGTLDVARNITASNINFKNGSILKVDGTKITDTAAIRNITSASVENGSKLYVRNAEISKEYKIPKGSNLDVRSWTTEETATGINASYGLKIDSVVNNGSEFNIKFTNDMQEINNSDMGNIIADLHVGSEVKEWVEAVSACQSDADVQNNTINTMANANQLANVQTGALTVSNLAMDTAFEHMSVFSNPVSHSATRIDFRNLANDNKKYKIDTISVGKIKDIQPTQGKTENENEQFTAEYVVHGHRTLQTRHAGGGHSSSFDDENKNVWATYIHSKQEIKDMKAGHLKQDSTVKQNGAAVGVDLWQSGHSFGGLSVTYAKGDVNSIQKVSTIKNDIDHYGVSIYHRQDSGKFSVQLDAGCGKSENDIKMQTLGAEDVTLKPKTEAYSAGIKIEEQLEVSSKTNLVPFIGVPYTHMKTKETQSNIDITYGANEQDMCSIPVGLSLRHIMPFSDGFKIGTTFEGGYIFSVGDKKGT
ncbi:MAG: autotransporter outer membrane beta-barrel domain-containing protein, partial [Phascolarctobacterium sp.]|nr:autotransporter outer membrane beta-barrel domain-containing protein [Candidatus Phascolarctobacterium caballi]